MPLDLAIDEILQADLQSAESAMDAAREAMTKQITEQEGQPMLAAAHRRYAIALRRLSLATSFGPLWPRDLAHQSNKIG